MKLLPIYILFVMYLSPLFASVNKDSNASQINNTVSFFSSFLWELFGILFFLLLLGYIFWFIRMAWKSRNSLNILPMINETGKEGEFDGVAAGIDDLLMEKLQKIYQLGSTEYIRSGWTSNPQVNEREKGKVSAKGQEVDVVGSGSLMHAQQFGDISIGPIKIPLRALLLLIFNIFGGKNLSGALQKYGKINTIVLRLETRLPMFSFGKSKNSKYFKVSWPSKSVNIDQLSAGVPVVIEELAFRILLSVSEEIGTTHWTAYKWFLKGNSAFNDFDKNGTRKDRLSDAIDCYRQSIYIDPYFAKAHYNLGVALDRMGGDKYYNDAIFRYKKAIGLDPKIIASEAHFSLAKIYWDIFKESQKALEELEKAEKFDKNLPAIYNLIGLIYLEKGDEGSNKKALQCFQNAKSKSDKKLNSLFLYNESVARFSLKDYKGAQKAGEAAMDNLKENSQEIPQDLLQILGRIHIQKAREDKEVKEDGYKKSLNYLKEGLNKGPNNLDMLFGYGEALREAGEPEEALVIQRRFIRLYPEYSSGYTEMAKTLKKLNHNENELNIYETVGSLLAQKINQNEILAALELKQTNPEQTIINKSVLGGYYLYVESDYAQAVKCYDDIAAELEEDSCLLKPEILHNYGLALMHHAKTSHENASIGLQQIQGLYDEASAKLEQAQALYNEDSQAYDIAACYTDLALSLDKRDDKEEAIDNNSYFDKATDIHILYQQASKLYQKTGLFHLASDTRVLNAEYLMGWKIENVYSFAGDAIKECDEAIHYDSSNASAYHAKGNIYFNTGDDANAIAQYEKAVELNYDQPDIHYNLGLSYFYTKEYEKAEKAFTTSIKLSDPKEKNIVETYAQLFNTFEKQNRWAEAVKRFSKIVNLSSGENSYQIHLGHALEQCNQMDEAAEAFKTVLEQDRENKQNLNHTALYHLADIYAEQGANLNEACRMAKEALKIKRKLLKQQPQYLQLLKTDKELAEINNTLGWIYYQKNQPKKARLLLEKTLSHSMSNPKWHARLAYAYEKEAKTDSDSSERSDLLEKAKVQWKIVSDLPLDKNSLKQTAQEHLKSIASTDI